MTDRETLFNYRFQQAMETLADAESMMKVNCTPRSIVNRTYYSLFYAVQALFIKEGTEVNTSRHAGIISIFDKEFVHAGKFDRKYSVMLHSLFDTRQEGDYREFTEVSAEDASKSIENAREFISAVAQFCDIR